MASTASPSSTAAREEQSQDLNFELRRVLSNSYNFVQGEKATQAFGAVTYEELADQQIERIEGKGTLTRPNELERVDRIEKELLALVEQIKTIPPEKFLLRDPDRDVNTAIDE